MRAPPIERSGAARQGPDQREAAPAGSHAPGESEARSAGFDRGPRQGERLQGGNQVDAQAAVCLRDQLDDAAHSAHEAVKWLHREAKPLGPHR